MLKLTLVTSAIIVAGLAANQVNAAYVMTDKERESQLAHAYIEGNPTTEVQKKISALTNGKEITGTIYKSDGSVDIKRTAQMLVKTNGKDPYVEMAKREAAQAVEWARLDEIARLIRLEVLGVVVAGLEAAYAVLADQLTTATTLVSDIEQEIEGIDSDIAAANTEIQALLVSKVAARAALDLGEHTLEQGWAYQDNLDDHDEFMQVEADKIADANTRIVDANGRLESAQANEAGTGASIRRNGADLDRAWAEQRANGGYSYPTP